MSQRRFVGSANEARVVADLYERGFEVFTPAMGIASSCDLLALSPDGILRIEVKTAHVSPDGYGGAKLVGCVPAPEKKDRFDILARVADGVVHYWPSVPLAKGAEDPNKRHTEEIRYRGMIRNEPTNRKRRRN